MRRPPRTVKGERLLTSGEVCRILRIRMRRLHWFTEAGIVEAPVTWGQAQARYRNWDMKTVRLLAVALALKDQAGINVPSLKKYVRKLRHLLATQNTTGQIRLSLTDQGTSGVFLDIRGLTTKLDYKR